MQALQPPPPGVGGHSVGKRQAIPPPPVGPLTPHMTTGERVKANVLVQLSKTDHTMVQSRSLFAAVIMQVKDDGEKFAIFCFDDESMHDVPASWVQRRDFSRGRTWAEVDADEEGAAGPRRKKHKRKAETGMHWRLDGLKSAFVRDDAQPAQSSMLDHLVFRAEVAYKVNGKFVTSDTPEIVSLRSMVQEQATEHEVDMYVKALYDMMQGLFHATPTEARRVELLGTVDPFDHGHAELASARAEIYEVHRRLAADARAGQGAQGGGG